MRSQVCDRGSCRRSMHRRHRRRFCVPCRRCSHEVRGHDEDRIMLIWASLLQAIDRAERAALVSVVRVFGSTPREAGARMVVTADEIIGTIGGGNLEWEAM